MKPVTIYEVSTSYKSDSLSFKQSEPIYSYFSNLSQLYRVLEFNLANNGWPMEGINYTALYRRIRSRGKVTIQIKIKGSSMLEIKINKLVMNNPLETMGIDRAPEL